MLLFLWKRQPKKGDAVRISPGGLQKMTFKQLAGRNLRHSQTAYTLAEVVVCVALIVILFVGLLGGMSSGFALTQDSRENLRATQVMLEYMEGIRLYNWYQLTQSNWIPQNFTRVYYPLANTNAGESQGLTYYGTVNIVTNPVLNPTAVYSPNMASVSVTVNWTNNAGAPHTRTMTTYSARNGMQNYIYTSTNN
jgi:type II secretory pathway pseudopilin PulG